MNSESKGLILIVTAATLWGISGTVAKYLFNGEAVNPLALVQIRLFLSAVLLGLYLLATDPASLRIKKGDIKYFAVLGVCGMAMVQFTYLYTVSQTNVAVAVFLQYLSPVLVAAYAVGFRREKLDLNRTMALVLALGGSIMILTGSGLGTLAVSRAGLISGLASAFFSAFYTLYAQGGAKRFGPWTTLTYSLGFGAIFWLAVAPPALTEFGEYSTSDLLFFLYIAVFATIVPFGLYFKGLTYMHATKAIITSTLEPVMAAVTAFLILGETMAPWQMLGGGLIIGAVVLLAMPKAAAWYRVAKTEKISLENK